MSQKAIIRRSNDLAQIAGSRTVPRSRRFGALAIGVGTGLARRFALHYDAKLPDTPIMGRDNEPAGRSAAEHAASLRAQAERLTREAETWERGAVGEGEIGRLLVQLESEGYVVIHDRQVPDGNANIDHIVIGPTGVTVIDTKNYSWPVTESKGELWTAKTPLRRKLQAIVYEAAAVERVLSGFLIPLGLRVAAVMCVPELRTADREALSGGVHVVEGRDLLVVLRRGATALTASEVAAIAQAARQRLAPAFDGSEHITAAVPPFPPPPPPTRTAPPSAHGRPPRPQRQRRPAKATGRARFDKLIRELIGDLAGIAIAGIAALALGVWYLPHLISSTSKHLTPTTTVPEAAAPGSVQPPALTSATFACASRGAGWTLNIPWPAGQPASSAYQAKWSLSPTGPWSPSPTWTGGAPLSVTGLGPDRHVFVQAKIAGGAADAPESMAMQKTPVRAC